MQPTACTTVHRVIKSVPAASEIPCHAAGMRGRRRGHIVKVTSMGGFITMPGISFYCGSQFALERLSEALGKEVAALSIKVTALAPGQFRTDWAGRLMQRTPRRVTDYDSVMNPIRAARQAKSGVQAGDPAKAALALLELTEPENPPTRLFPGEDALGMVRQKLDSMAMDYVLGRRSRVPRASCPDSTRAIPNGRLCTSKNGVVRTPNAPVAKRRRKN